LTQTRSLDLLVEQFWGARLPPQITAGIDFPTLPHDIQAFIMRMLPLMKRAGCGPNAFTTSLVRWLSGTVPSLFPSRWDRQIPPITFPNRHQKLDAYVGLHNWSRPKDTPVFIDLGCGFPPVTTADTASYLPNWQIFGVDRAFAEYVLYDRDGNYACFGPNGEFQYFQAMMTASGRAMYADSETTRKRFNALFSDLFPLLPDLDDRMQAAVEHRGNRLIYNHIRDFESDNLVFIKSDLETLSIRSASVVRCMNLLIYFDPAMRKKLLLQASEHLEHDGILIAGTNGPGIQARYAVYHKDKMGLVLNEFAFSLDNLGPIVFMPWVTIHDNDPEAMLLADILGILRRERTFWPGFSRRVDDLLQHYGICQRGEDGFLQFPEKEMTPSEYFKQNARIWGQIEQEGFHDRAVDALKRAGYTAWKNPVGDVAIWPATDFFMPLA
jgi:hypothetical protein